MEKYIIFKPFQETFKIISLSMKIGMIYPDPKLERQKVIVIPILFISVTPLAVIVLNEMLQCYLTGDYINTIRHSTVIGPFLGGFLKIILMYMHRKKSIELISEIDNDYKKFRYLDQKDKKIVAASIRIGIIYSERAWAMTVIACCMIFPVMAIVLTAYSFMFDEEPRRYMLHDVKNPFNDDPESRLKSPFYEIMFVYMFYGSLIYVANFIGHDAFFGLCINHACLKMALYCRALEEAMKDERRRYEKVVAVIKEQCRTYEYIEIIQDVFNIWLGIILVATMIQVGTCMYHIIEGYGFDLRYIVCISGSVIHIYLPCFYASKLKFMAADVPTLIYCSGWESTSDQRIKNMLVFMIARGQLITEITAFNIFTFDMELFVSIMKTSYSMFTLMRS